MADYFLRIKYENCFGMQFDSFKQLDIIQSKDDYYIAKFIRKNKKNERVISNTKLKNNEVDKIMEKLSTINLPAFPNHQMGLDGGFTELEVGDYAGKSHFRW